MRGVSYQAILDEQGARADADPRAVTFAPLRPGAIATRRKDARRSVSVRLAPDQVDWLQRVRRASGGAASPDAVVRALVDLARELEVDWAAVRSGAELRAAVAEAVAVRRRAG